MFNPPDPNPSIAASQLTKPTQSTKSTLATESTPATESTQTIGLIPVTELTSATELTQDFLPPLGAWIKFGGLFILGTIAIVVAIASVARYRVTVKAPAAIRPTGELRIVQAATAGTVMQVRITPNQVVQRGEVLAQIDDSTLQTRRSQLRASIQQTNLQILQFQAQMQSIDNQMAAERDRQSRAVAASEAEWHQRQYDYQNQQVVARAEVAEAKAMLQAAQAAFQTATTRVARYRPIAAEGALERDRLAEADLAVQQQAQEVAAAQAKLQRAQAALHPTNATVLMAQERMAQEQAAGTASLAALRQERQSLMQQQIQLQNQLELDTRELSQVQRDLLKTTLRSPIAGTIAKLNLRNSGQTVQPGDEIAQIVPQATQLTIKQLTIKAWVAAADINQVEVGQTAQFRVSACPYPDYGTLVGTVRALSPDAVKQPGSQPDAAQAVLSQPVYEVTLEPQSLVLSQRDRHCPIQVGMEGSLDIISREDTVLRSILRKARLIADF